MSLGAFIVELIRRSRRTTVLTPSSLPCLKAFPTINITEGCAHGCIYCYTRGYSNYPGDGRVVLFENTPDLVSQELSRKRRKPRRNAVKSVDCPAQEAQNAVLGESFLFKTVTTLENRRELSRTLENSTVAKLRQHIRVKALTSFGTQKTAGKTKRVISRRARYAGGRPLVGLCFCIASFCLQPSAFGLLSCGYWFVASCSGCKYN